MFTNIYKISKIRIKKLLLTINFGLDTIYLPGEVLGRRQVVRHLVLVQAFGGSNPSAPEFKRDDLKVISFCVNIINSLAV